MSAMNAIAKRPFDETVKVDDMGSGGNLGNNTSIRGVIANLRQYVIGQNCALALCGAPHQGGSCLVTGGLDAENGQLSRHVAI